MEIQNIKVINIKYKLKFYVIWIQMNKHQVKEENGSEPLISRVLVSRALGETLQITNI